MVISHWWKKRQVVYNISSVQPIYFTRSLDNYGCCFCFQILYTDIIWLRTISSICNKYKLTQTFKRWKRLEAFAQNGRRSLPNCTFNALIFHSALWISLEFARCGIISTDARRLDVSISANSANLQARMILTWIARNLVTNSLSSNNAFLSVFFRLLDIPAEARG